MDPSYLEKIQTWRATRQQLDEIIQRHLQSTTDLDAIPCDVIKALSVAETGIRDIWREMYDDLKSIPAKMQSMESTMNILHSKLIRNRFTPLVPISKLPLGILLNIFYLCVRKPKNALGARLNCGSYHCSSSKLHVPSRVCSQWRALAVNEPSFWSHLIFGADNYYQPRAPWTRLQIFPKRSGGRPLCVTVRGDLLLVQTTRQEMEVVFRYLQPFAAKVRHLRFLYFTQYRKHLAWFLANVGAPGLQSLYLEGDDLHALDRSPDTPCDQQNVSCAGGAKPRAFVTLHPRTPS